MPAVRRQERSSSANNITKANPKRMLSRRFLVVVGLFVLWGVGIGARLVYLQTTQHLFLSEKAIEQRQRERKTKPLRGAILDRKGRELAVTLEVESLWADPTELENAEAVAYKLAPALNQKPRELLAQIGDAREQKKRFVWLARELERDQAQKVKDLSLPGLRWRKEQKRFYPHGSLAAQVVGFSNRDEIGQAGIELVQDKNLRGEYNEIVEERDGKGRVYEIAERVVQPPRNVTLTIDFAVQYRVEQALSAGVQAARAKSGTAVVLDPTSGEILAMATVPTFDLNEPGEVKPEILTNRAAQNLYEPGSTFKLVTYAAALEEGAARADTTFDASAGFIKVGNRRIPDSHPEKHALALTDAFAKSSNVAAVTLGQRLSKERFHEYVRRFGYGAPTGVELPGETRGLLRAAEKWTPDSVASISIGYEIGVTTLQSAAAYAAIANDGVRVQPHLIKEIREEDGRVFSRTHADERRVVSAKTAQTMREMLEAVTERGTGKLALANGYTAGGKTGTAHKFDVQTKKYAPNKYVASFVGYAPAEKPAVVIAVMIDEPGTAAHFGGDIAAPVFREIAEQILPELDIAPTHKNSAADEVLTARNDTINQPTQISLKQTDEKQTNLEKQDRETTVKAASNQKQSAKSDQKPADKTTTRESPAPKAVASAKANLTNEPRPRIITAEKKIQTAAKPTGAAPTKNAKSETTGKPTTAGKPKKT